MYMFHKTIKPVVFVSRSLPGIDRLFLALLCSAYDEDEIDGDKRSVLRQRIKEGNEKNKHKKIYTNIICQNSPCMERSNRLGKSGKRTKMRAVNGGDQFRTSPPAKL